MTASASSGGAKNRTLPFSWLWPVAAGAAIGLVWRLVFSGGPASSFATMDASYLLLAPVAVGAVTVYFAERQHRRSVGYYMGAPFLANSLLVAAALAFEIEGWICAILAVPLFGLLGSVGGILMGAVCRLTGRPRPTLYGLSVLPLAFGLLELGIPLPEGQCTIERSMHIESPPAVVWAFIQNTGAIRPEEVEGGWVYRLGVPLPEVGETVHGPHGALRRIRMGKGIHFDQVVAEEVPMQYVRWTYRFDKDSVPAGALDEHVALGGAYFDVRDTSYTLTPNAGGTDLRLRMDLRVSTHFNWYAVPLADALFGNLEETLLTFYRRRSEAASQAANSNR